MKIGYYEVNKGNEAGFSTRKPLFLKVVSFKLHTLLQCFDTFLVIRFVEVLKPSVCLSDNLNVIAFRRALSSSLEIKNAIGG